MSYFLSATATAKAKAKAKPRAKRSRTEIVADDVKRLTNEFGQLVESLKSFPSLPKSTEIGRVDRMITKKKSEFKDSFDFEAVNELTKLYASLELLRNAVKPASAYMTGTLQTKKKVQGDFISKMSCLQKEKPDVFANFPQETISAWLECDVTHRVERMEWEHLATVVSQNEVEKYGTDPVSTFEKVIAFYVKKMESTSGSLEFIEGQVKGFGQCELVIL